MAKREFSNGLQHLKFMQRARQREDAIKKAEEEEVAIDDSHWVAPGHLGASGKGCVVIMEGDPKPGALLGRMSFQNCNSSIDKLVEEVEAIYSRKSMVARERAETVSTAADTLLRQERDGFRDDNTRSSVHVAGDAEQDVQKKKPKLGASQNSFLGGLGVQNERRNDGKALQNERRNDVKAWQGWRGGGDYRLLKPPGSR